jgi:hypothetical protein
MKMIIQAYNANRFNIQFFIENLLNNFDLTNTDTNSLKYMIKQDRAIELLYFVNNEYKQTTPSIWKNKVDDSRQGIDKSYYFKFLNCKDNCVQISNPYIHYETGTLTITFSKKIDTGYFVMDFNLEKLLEELHYIENTSLLKNINMFIISITGIILSAISFFLIMYGGYIFVQMFYNRDFSNVLHVVFSSIIGITIGIALYDLSKTLIENEIFHRKSDNKSDNINNSLLKFLSSIIIALSIEALMVIFKIVLDDYKNMLYGLFLLAGVGIMIVSTAIYGYISNKKH